MFNFVCGAGFELRALHLLGSHSMAWVTPPTPYLNF
jgi:hypothetical protein